MPTVTASGNEIECVEPSIPEKISRFLGWKNRPLFLEHSIS